MAKCFTQIEGIDYNKTFSSVSCKDSFRIIMPLVAHYDLELHQMDVKTTFLNKDLEENICMAQPKDFVVEGKERMGCRLKKSICRLKQASRQWYLKFDSTIRKFGFQENVEDNYVYAKFKNGKYIFLVLYVNDNLLVSSDVNLLLETKKFLSSKFDMKDLGSRWQRVPETRVPDGFYPIRRRVWKTFCTRGYVIGRILVPIGYAGTGVDVYYPYPHTHG